MNVFSGSSTFKKVADEARVERDRDRLAVVGDRQLDARLADLGRLAGEHERAVAEREIDAAAFFAGDDRRLPDGRVHGPDGEVDLDRARPLREHVSPARVAAFEQPRVDRGPRVLHEDVVLPDGELHFAAVLGQGPLQELHRARGDDGHIAERGGLADGLGRAFHLGEAAAIGADGGEHVVLPLQLHAAQGVAAAFVVGGEDRAADQLAEQPGRELVVARLAELGDRRESLAGFPTAA